MKDYFFTSCLINPVSKISKLFTSIDGQQNFFIGIIIGVSKITVIFDLYQILRFIKICPSLYHFIVSFHFDVVESELICIMKWDKVLILNIPYLFRQIDWLSHISWNIFSRPSLIRLSLSFIFLNFKILSLLTILFIVTSQKTFNTEIFRLSYLIYYSQACINHFDFRIICFWRGDQMLICKL